MTYDYVINTVAMASHGAILLAMMLWPARFSAYQSEES